MSHTFSKIRSRYLFRFLFLPLFFILISVCFSYGQKNVAVSANSKFFASALFEKNSEAANSESKNYLIDIYSISSKAKIRSFRLKCKKKSCIDTIFFSADGKSLYARLGADNYVMDIKSGNIIMKFRNEKMLPRLDLKNNAAQVDENILAFANQDNFFLIAKNNKIEAYDSYSGEEIMTYEKIPSSNKIINFFVSEDDNYIVIIDSQHKIYLWLTGKSKIRKKFSGSNIKFDNASKRLVLSRDISNNFHTYVYKFPEFERINKANSLNVLRDIARNRTDEFKERHPEMKDVNYLPAELIPEKATLSPNGKLFIVPTIKDKLYNTLLVIDAATNEPVYEIQEKNKARKFIPYIWANDSMLFLYDSDMTLSVFNVSSKRYVDRFNYRFTFNRNEHIQSDKKQVKYRKVSSDKRYVTLPFSTWGTSGLYMRSAGIEQKKSKATNADFITYTPDSKYIIVKSNNEIGCIKTSDIEANLSEQELNIAYFTDTITTIIEKAFATDPKQPDEFHHTRINTFKHISTATDTSILIDLSLKTVALHDSVIGLQVHLIDQYGTYYYGAGTEKWKHIWCNLLLKSPDGVVKQISDFGITEYSDTDTIPNAIALVLDHSGSMGDERAFALQDGAEAFIQNKRDKDAVAIVKYDNRIGVESFLSNDKKKLLNRLQKNGLAGYGRGTALLDGINTAIATLKNAEGYSKKSVIILTDGNENSSIASKRDVLLRAVDNGINVFTIGFGDYVSKEYLKAIALNTEGSSYQIYNTKDFKWVFDDIYKRIRNYYSLKFNSELKGKHVSILKVCLDNGTTDSLIVEIDNSSHEIRDDKDIISPVSDVDEKDVDKEEFNIANITDFESVKIVPQLLHVTDTAVVSTQDITIIEEEFERIEFPDIKFVFDKTEIIHGTEKGIEHVVAFLKKYPALRLRIVGHTDDVGSSDYNQSLSYNRAQKVKELLVNRGINRRRILTKGMGDKQPIFDNKTERSRDQNRRVEFRILD